MLGEQVVVSIVMKEGNFVGPYNKYDFNSCCSLLDLHGKKQLSKDFVAIHLENNPVV